MTSRQYTPRPYANLATDFIARHPRCALWARPGMGKTAITLTFLDLLHHVIGQEGPSLVLAPLRVARDTWSTECAKWEHLSELSIATAVGDKSARLAALNSGAQVHITNYEQLPWLVAAWGSRWPYKTVVADECTRIRGFRLGGSKGVRARALSKVAFKGVERWINLTGTPAASGLESLWGQTWFLDRGVRLGRTFSGFQERWFRPVRGDSGFYSWKPLAHSQAEIQDRLSDICLTLDPADWFDNLPPLLERKVEITLSRKQMAEYKQLEKELFLSLKSGNNVEAFSVGGKLMKCRQYVSGNIYLTNRPGEWELVHDEKMDALDSILSESGGEPVIVAYYFKPELERLRAKYPEALDLRKKEDLQAAIAGKGSVWLAHPDSLGHGIDGLQHHCSTIVFFALDWSFENRTQLIDRIGPVRQRQSGRNRPVFVHNIVAKDTIDELVLARNQSRKSVHELLLDYMKRKEL